MSTQPFGQPTFGAQPAAPAPVDSTPEPATGGRRTLVIAVAAGVVALGVLGGAAALVLADDPAVDDAALGPAPAVVEPEPSATAAVRPPLPTTVIQGRNVFVPLVEAGDPSSGAPEAAPVAAPAASPTAAPTSAAGSRTGTSVPGLTGGSGSVGSLPVPTVTVTEQVTLTQFLSDTELIRELRTRIAQLEAQVAGSVDSETAEELRAEIARLQAELTEAESAPTYDFDIFVADVLDPTRADTEVVFWLEDETQEAGYSEYTVSSTSEDPTFGAEGELTYMSFDPETGIVTFQYVSNVYRVVEGTALGFDEAEPEAEPDPAPEG